MSYDQLCLENVSLYHSGGSLILKKHVHYVAYESWSGFAFFLRLPSSTPLNPSTTTQFTIGLSALHSVLNF